MLCMKSICEYELARGKDRTISVIFFCDGLFLLSLQIFPHCVARLESKIVTLGIFLLV